MHAGLGAQQSVGPSWVGGRAAAGRRVVDAHTLFASEIPASTHTVQPSYTHESHRNTVGSVAMPNTHLLYDRPHRCPIKACAQLTHISHSIASMLAPIPETLLQWVPAAVIGNQSSYFALRILPRPVPLVLDELQLNLHSTRANTHVVSPYPCGRIHTINLH